MAIASVSHSKVLNAISLWQIAATQAFALSGVRRFVIVTPVTSRPAVLVFSFFHFFWRTVII